MELSWSDARRLRIQAQGLGFERAADVESAVRAAGAIQAQDRLGMLLGVGTRSVGLTAADVDHARNVERSVVRSWLMRGTLHLVAGSDFRWMLGLLGEKMDAKALKRRADLGISADDHARVLELFRRHLAGGGTIVRSEIPGALEAAGLPAAGQAPRHLLRTASMLGVICFGADRDDDEAHVLIDEWLPDPGLEPSDPAAELARRYFAAYGPATAADFRWWTGLPAADTRRGFEAVAGELAEVSVEGTAMWMTSEAAAQTEQVLAAPDHRVRVAGPFDPYLLGYAKRELGVAGSLLKRINAGGGMIRSCVLIDGRLVGTWDRKRRARGLAVTVTAFEALSDEAQSQLDAEFAEIGRFLGTEINWSLALDPAAARSE